VRDQEVLGLLRIDVHAAGDDHERLAVGEVEEAVVVDVADVADGAHRPVGRHRLLALLRRVEVLERCRHLNQIVPGVPTGTRFISSSRM
jgi:hypothetical protein